MSARSYKFQLVKSSLPFLQFLSFSFHILIFVIGYVLPLTYIFRLFVFSLFRFLSFHISSSIIFHVLSYLLCCKYICIYNNTTITITLTSHKPISGICRSMEFIVTQHSGIFIKQYHLQIFVVINSSVAFSDLWSYKLISDIFRSMEFYTA